MSHIGYFLDFQSLCIRRLCLLTPGEHALCSVSAHLTWFGSASVGSSVWKSHHSDTSGTNQQTSASTRCRSVCVNLSVKNLRCTWSVGRRGLPSPAVVECHHVLAPNSHDSWNRPRPRRRSGLLHQRASDQAAVYLPVIHWKQHSFALHLHQVFDGNLTIICVTTLIWAYVLWRIPQEYVGQHWYLNNQVAQQPKCVCCFQMELWSRDSASSVCLSLHLILRFTLHVSLSLPLQLFDSGSLSTSPVISPSRLLAIRW